MHHAASCITAVCQSQSGIFEHHGYSWNAQRGITSESSNCKDKNPQHQSDESCPGETSIGGETEGEKCDDTSYSLAEQHRGQWFADHQLTGDRKDYTIEITHESGVVSTDVNAHCQATKPHVFQPSNSNPCTSDPAIITIGETGPCLNEDNSTRKQPLQVNTSERQNSSLAAVSADQLSHTTVASQSPDKIMLFTAKKQSLQEQGNVGNPPSCTLQCTDTQVHNAACTNDDFTSDGLASRKEPSSRRCSPEEGTMTNKCTCQQEQITVQNENFEHCLSSIQHCQSSVQQQRVTGAQCTPENGSKSFGHVAHAEDAIHHHSTEVTPLNSTQSANHSQQYAGLSDESGCPSPGLGDSAMPMDSSNIREKWGLSPLNGSYVSRESSMTFSIGHSGSTRCSPVSEWWDGKSSSENGMSSRMGSSPQPRAAYSIQNTPCLSRATNLSQCTFHHNEQHGGSQLDMKADQFLWHTALPKTGSNTEPWHTAVTEVHATMSRELSATHLQELEQKEVATASSIKSKPCTYHSNSRIVYTPAEDLQHQHLLTYQQLASKASFRAPAPFYRGEQRAWHPLPQQLPLQGSTSYNGGKKRDECDERTMSHDMRQHKSTALQILKVRCIILIVI